MPETELYPGAPVRVRVANFLTGEPVEWTGQLVSFEPDEIFCVVRDDDGDEYTVPCSKVSLMLK